MSRLSEQDKFQAYTNSPMWSDSASQAGFSRFSQYSAEAAPPRSFGLAQESKFVRLAGPVTTRSLSTDQAPTRIILRLQSFWNLSDQDLLAMCGLPTEPDQSPAQALAKYAAVPDVKTRLRSLMNIRMRLSAMLNGDKNSERRFLSATWDQLDGNTPLQLMISTNITDLLRVESEIRKIAGA